MKKAFSFIELIVVVTIIAVLSLVGMVNYSSANKKSRDARRISDLEKMRMALEMIKQVGTTYPISANSLVPLYLDTLPTTPKGVGYSYGQTSGGYSYVIYTVMEDIGSTNCTSCGSFNYKVSSP